MDEQVIAEPFDEGSRFLRGYLYEAALRLIGAFGEPPGFPDDVAGVEDLLGRVPEGEPGEVMGFAVERPDQLPRYTGRHLVWVSPVGDGRLRLRAEGAGLKSTSVTLRPDGRLGEFSNQQGFGVAEAELTEQARADRDEIERRLREDEVADAESSRRIDEDQRRFRTEHLLDVRIAPPQDPAGLVVTWLGLYDTGVIVNYLVPRPPEEEIDRDEALLEAARPKMELSDRLGTRYDVVDVGSEDVTGALLRASRGFAPAISRTVSRLVIRTDWGSVEIEVGPR